LRRDRVLNQTRLMELGALVISTLASEMPMLPPRLRATFISAEP